jgi:iron complex outermembrane receptor protein
MPSLYFRSEIIYYAAYDQHNLKRKILSLNQTEFMNLSKPNKIILFLSAILSSSFNSFPQQKDTANIVKEEVIITAGMVPVSVSEVPRNVSIIRQEDILNSPVQNLQDLMSYVPGLDVRTRGLEGVQADVSIRGGSFEQTLILLDGVKLNDPQTGHHNMNLPVNTNDIERVEILKGQASSIYGPNAFAGVINFITKKETNSELSANLSGGSFGFFNGGLSVHVPYVDSDNMLSISKSQSDGYMHNTNFDITTFYYKSCVSLNSGSANVAVGYTEKSFGANGFYTTKYPNQWEQTKTLLVSTGADYSFGQVKLIPEVFWRSNQDHYLLDYTNPAFYMNDHKTNSYGAELRSIFLTNVGSIELGGDLNFDNINSSNLGIHSRREGGISAEYVTSPIENFKVLLNGFAYNYDDYGWKFIPGLDLVYQISNNFNCYTSFGKSFRIPTYTELYYNSPAQKGNALLQPEEAISYETGANYNAASFSGNLSLFSRNGKNLIDWAKGFNDINGKYLVQNIAAINTYGIDMGISYCPLFGFDSYLKKIILNYTYLKSNFNETNLLSQYILDLLRHQFIAEITHSAPLDIIFSWAFRYENRYNFDSYFITDLKLSRSFNNFDLSLSALNLFNKLYVDITGIPLPGRWIKAGINCRINNF